MMTLEEHKLWQEEQHKKINMPKKKKRKQTLWSNRETRKSRSIAKYGIYKLRGRLPGSFGGRSGG